MLRRDFLLPDETPDALRECAMARARDIVERTEKLTKQITGRTRADILREILAEAILETYIEGRASSLVHFLAKLARPAVGGPGTTPIIASPAASTGPGGGAAV